MSLDHQNLAVAVGAAKEQAKALVLDVQRDSVPTGRSSSVYLSLVVMHQQLLAADPPPIAHFIPDLEQLARSMHWDTITRAPSHRSGAAGGARCP